MDKNFYRTAFIEKYLKGQLNREEREAFEKAVESDQELRKLVRFKQDIFWGIALLGKKELDQSLYAVEKQLEAEGFFLNETHIQQYFSGELDPKWKPVLENRLTRDEAFEKLFNFQRDLLQGIEGLGVEKEEGKLFQVEDQLAKEGFFDQPPSQSVDAKKTEAVKKPEAKRRVLYTRSVLYIAASILLLLSLSIYLLWPPSEYDQLFASFYEVESVRLSGLLDELDSSGMATPDQRRRASLLELLLQFESGEYEAAARGLSDHLNNYPEDEEARFYYGLSLLETGQYQPAVAALTPVSEQSTTWNKEASWYLSLSLLKSGEEQSAVRILLQQIADDDNSPYQDQAADLLERL